VGLTRSPIKTAMLRYWFGSGPETREPPHGRDHEDSKEAFLELKVDF